MATAAKYAKETFWAVASKGAAFFFYYALLYYLTRRMTVDMWGEWSAFLALLNIILLISDQGINTASKRYLAAARDTDELGLQTRRPSRASSQQPGVQRQEGVEGDLRAEAPRRDEPAQRARHASAISPTKTSVAR